MAFDKNNLDPTSSGSKGVKTIATYQTGDNRATVIAAGYFNSVWSEMSRVGVVLVISSDKMFFAKVAVAGKVVTLSAMDHHTDLA